MMKWMLRAVFYGWISLVAVSFLTELDSSYYIVSAVYAEKCAEYADCKLAGYYIRYPIKCAKVLSNPPGSFVSEWVTSAFNNVKWCGVSRCEQLFTWKGAAVALFFSMQQATRVARRGRAVYEETGDGAHFLPESPYGLRGVLRRTVRAFREQQNRIQIARMIQDKQAAVPAES